MAVLVVVVNLGPGHSGMGIRHLDFHLSTFLLLKKLKQTIKQPVSAVHALSSSK